MDHPNFPQRTHNKQRLDGNGARDKPAMILGIRGQQSGWPHSSKMSITCSGRKTMVSPAFKLFCSSEQHGMLTSSSIK